MSNATNASLVSLEKCDYCIIKKETIFGENFNADIFVTINVVILTTIIGFFGILANIINIIVFRYQGMKTTVGICFMALSITDMLNLLSIEWFCLCFNPLFVAETDFPFVPGEIQHLTGGFPHACFARITAWITVFMTAERCFCILFPFKIRELITPRRTVTVITCIYAVVIAAVIPEYIYVHIDWKFYPNSNKTLLGLVFDADKTYLDGLSFLLCSILIVTSFPATILFTAILIYKLKQKTHWRNQAVKHQKSSNSLDYKERLAIRSVVVVAGVLICTFTPTFVFSALGFIVRGFSINGEYRNVFLIFSSFAFVFDAINSSINIVIYYKLNSGFRRTCLQLLHGYICEASAFPVSTLDISKLEFNSFSLELKLI